MVDETQEGTYRRRVPHEVTDKQHCDRLETVNGSPLHTGLLALLEAHGLTENDLQNHSAPLTELEMFLQEYPKVRQNIFCCFCSLPEIVGP